MSEIKTAFDNLITTIETETVKKFKALEAKAKAKRLEQLERDLAELNHLKETKK